MWSLQYDQRVKSLELTKSHPIPKPNTEEGEHLLKVHSTAITKGELYWQFPEECFNDYSPGVEMSGTVVKSPPNSKFHVGNNVYMRTTSPRSGSAREYTIALESELALQPRNLTAEQAAAVPVSAITAWEALFVQAGFAESFERPGLSPSSGRGRRVLIIGASGSVGLWTAQFARAAGFWVAGTSHPRNISITREYGVSEVIDYTTTSIRDWIDGTKAEKFDLVLDCVNPGASDDAWYAAHPDHGLVLAVVPVSGPVLKWTLERPPEISAKVEGRFFIMSPNGEMLQRITELIEAGKVSPIVDSIFDLEEYQSAFARVDSGMTTGKVVIRVQR